MRHRGHDRSDERTRIDDKNGNGSERGEIDCEDEAFRARACGRVSDPFRQSMANICLLHVGMPGVYRQKGATLDRMYLMNVVFL